MQHKKETIEIVENNSILFIMVILSKKNSTINKSVNELFWNIKKKLRAPILFAPFKIRSK